MSYGEEKMDKFDSKSHFKSLKQQRHEDLLIKTLSNSTLLSVIKLLISFKGSITIKILDSKVNILF